MTIQFVTFDMCLFRFFFLFITKIVVHFIHVCFIVLAPEIVNFDAIAFYTDMWA